MEQAKALDLLEPLDWKAIDPDPIFDEARQEKAIGYQYYTTLMAWRSDAKPVETWQQFWDVDAFPGKRALPNYPTYRSEEHTSELQSLMRLPYAVFRLKKKSTYGTHTTFSAP